jgi:hypothetical protein
MNGTIAKISIQYFTHDDDIFTGVIVRADTPVKCQLLKIGITSGQSCRESSGVKTYCSAGIQISDFIGATINKITIDDPRLISNETMLRNIFQSPTPRAHTSRQGQKSCLVLSVDTSVGILYVGLFNKHNGYYPHRYYIKFDSREDYELM